MAWTILKKDAAGYPARLGVAQRRAQRHAGPGVVRRERVAVVGARVQGEVRVAQPLEVRRPVLAPRKHRRSRASSSPPGKIFAARASARVRNELPESLPGA